MLSRFVQRDSAGTRDGVNLYAYCRNNSLRRRDPMGNLSMQYSILQATFGNCGAFDVRIKWFLADEAMDARGEAYVVTEHPIGMLIQHVQTEWDIRDSKGRPFKFSDHPRFFPQDPTTASDFYETTPEWRIGYDNLDTGHNVDDFNQWKQPIWGYKGKMIFKFTAMFVEGLTAPPESMPRNMEIPGATGMNVATRPDFLNGIPGVSVAASFRRTIIATWDCTCGISATNLSWASGAPQTGDIRRATPE